MWKIEKIDLNYDSGIKIKNYMFLKDVLQPIHSSSVKVNQNKFGDRVLLVVQLSVYKDDINKRKYLVLFFFFFSNFFANEEKYAILLAPVIVKLSKAALRKE